MSNQSSHTVLLVRPANFGFNPETAASNAFQQDLAVAQDDVKAKAQAEFDHFSQTLRQEGIRVVEIEDTVSPTKPDAVFPNNWFSTHPDGTVVIYPMLSPARRLEKRMDILAHLGESHQLGDRIDLSDYEEKGVFLEGTGSIVFDHIGRVAYACLSERTNAEVLGDLCERIGYEPFVFEATDAAGLLIYHTNVMMCIAHEYAVVCLACVSDAAQRQRLLQKLEQGGRTVVQISREQMGRFAGNMLELVNLQGEAILVMSQSAWDALSQGQRDSLSQYAKLIPIAIPTIEAIGGGSARCMMAEIFLPLR